ncbi:MAG: acylphosphatase [Phycisphaerales bacterium]|nr:acylphosphatase [Phycisphaerales bacterium]
MERRRIVFSGRVQGVGFRATARSIAWDFPVTGWVRNTEDDTVEMEVQGESTEIERFLGILRGRMAGYIRSENAEPIGAQSGDVGFEIRR